MKNILNAQWIKNPKAVKDCETVFTKEFKITKEIVSASFEVTALGVYLAKINGERVGDFILAPGWTSYRYRLQVDTYDVTAMLKKNKNTISLGVAPGWKASTYFGMHFGDTQLGYNEIAALCALTVEYADGETEIITSGGDWKCENGKTVYSTIYNGYIYNPAFVDINPMQALVFSKNKKILLDRQGEKVVEHERLSPIEIIITPKGETVLDFGQNLTGYVEFRIKGNKGERAVISHAEVLDAEGNFYTENLRSAKAQAVFICDGKEHTYKSEYNFFGFRYIRLENWSDEVKKENFTAIVVHSDIRRTGYFECSDERVNKLFSNIIWGQKGNFLDVPTDCPQRDERLGWTGDAQVFVKTASYNFDVQRFFTKWLADLRADQTNWGSVPHVIPGVFEPDDNCSAAWADAATICPWQIYQTYANTDILKDSLESMKKYIEFIEEHSVDGIWCRSWHFGDWLNLDGSSPEDCSKGTEKDLIATAYYIYSSDILAKTMALCGEDNSEVKAKREKSILAFRREYMENGRIKPEFATQTACVLAVHFGISDDIAETAKQLNELVTECGHLKTGFVGTPYLLHALSDNGYAETAYSLLLREEYPSWLFSVKMGATTIWEHWDSVREDGTMWSTSMNSFNHYAYGSVADWLYGDAAGIKIDENRPGFEHVIFAPLTDGRLTYVKAAIESRKGLVKSEWKTDGGKTVYTFTVPEGVDATVILGGEETKIGSGVTEIVK